MLEVTTHADDDDDGVDKTHSATYLYVILAKQMVFRASCVCPTLNVTHASRFMLLLLLMTLAGFVQTPSRRPDVHMLFIFVYL